MLLSGHLHAAHASSGCCQIVMQPLSGGNLTNAPLASAVELRALQVVEVTVMTR